MANIIYASRPIRMIYFRASVDEIERLKHLGKVFAIRDVWYLEVDKDRDFDEAIETVRE